MEVSVPDPLVFITGIKILDPSRLKGFAGKNSNEALVIKVNSKRVEPTVWKAQAKVLQGTCGDGFAKIGFAILGSQRVFEKEKMRGLLYQHLLFFCTMFSRSHCQLWGTG